MPGLVDSAGRPLSSDFATTRRRRRITPPSDLIIGDTIGQWAGQELMRLTLPGGTVLQFDLDKLTMEDFRQMRNNYQLSASLNVLTFMMHQLDWEIECDDQDIADAIETNMRDRWTRLIRALSQSFWAGYSPTCIVYQNNPQSGFLEVAKFKDLVPEQARVNWLETDGVVLPSPSEGLLISDQNTIPPKILSFNGIKHFPQTGAWGDGGHGPWMGGYGTTGQAVVIPAENSLWYSLLMENGDYYGRKLLKPAFPAYYFSQLIHLFSNRYYERYGEPTPVGRANFDDEVLLSDETTVNGKKAMETMLLSLRNRSVLVLPSDRDPDTKEYEYDIQYLQSEMRGADFERYLSRLDEEMSLALFTPILLFRTADVGSYNLGNIHQQVFQQMLNSIAGDMQEYIDNYVVDRLRVFNFGENSPKARWKFRMLGKGDMQTYQLMLQQLVAGNQATPNLEELSVAVGITMEKVEQITAPVPTPAPAVAKTTAQRALRETINEAIERMGREIHNSWGSKINMKLGYRNRFHDELRHLGYDPEEAKDETTAFYTRINGAASELGGMAAEFGNPSALRDAIAKLVTSEAAVYFDGPIDPPSVNVPESRPKKHASL